jgi:hypothetical protein
MRAAANDAMTEVQCAAIRERDEALAILRDLAAGGAAAFNDAMDRARKLVGGAQ